MSSKTPYDPHASRRRYDNDALSTSQVRRLLAGIDNERDSFLVELGVHLGGRVNEIAGSKGIRLSKVDYAGNTITVWDDKKNPHTGNRRKHTYKKTGEGIWRKIKLPRSFMQRVRLFAEGYSKNGMLVPYSYKTLENIIQHWTNEVLGSPRSWHCLRHTMLTLGSKQKKSMEWAMKQSGDTAATILKVYRNITADQWEEETERPLF